jgi:nuclear transport factor 2 (NTF2) superfamily protein
MKKSETTQQIINHLMDAKNVYGEYNVENGINTILGWYHTYGNESWQIVIADQYIVLALKVATHPMLEADLVYDMELGHTVLDSRGLILDVAPIPLDVDAQSARGV